jgi:integrase
VIDALGVHPASAGLWSRARTRRTWDAWALALRRFHEYAAARARPRVAPSDVELSFFLQWLLASARLAPSTAHRVLADLRSALALFGVTTPLSQVSLLASQGLRRLRPLPALPPPSTPVSRLLAFWLRLSTQSAVDRRDRALVLAALLLGARPSDLTRLARDDVRVLHVDRHVVRVVVPGDKGSALRGGVASLPLFLPRWAPFDFGACVEQVLRDAPLRRFVPAARRRVPRPLFVRLDSDGFGLPLAPTSVSRVLVRFLLAAGLSPAQARARFIRAYAASSAYELGVPISEVCRHFRWRHASTFADHYHRGDVERPLSLLPTGSLDGRRVVLAFFSAFVRDCGDRLPPPPPAE